MHLNRFVSPLLAALAAFCSASAARRGTAEALRTAGRPGRQGRDLGADPGRGGRPHAAPWRRSSRTTSCIDLGAGNGKIAIAAAKKFGARAMGIEYNPDMAKHAQGNVVAAGVTGQGARRAGRHLRHRFQPGDGGDDVPAAGAEHEAAAARCSRCSRARASSRTPSPWRTGTPTRSPAWTGGAPTSGWCRRTSTAAGRSRAGAEKNELVFEQRFQKIEGTIGLGHTQGGLRNAAPAAAPISASRGWTTTACCATTPAASAAARWKAAGAPTTAPKAAGARRRSSSTVSCGSRHRTASLRCACSRTARPSAPRCW